MRLERLSAEMRPRNAWEAMDLGLQMARARFLKLWLLWWLSALPVSLLAGLLLHDYPEYIGTAVWWFKPLFEPLLLFWLSRALFNEDPTFTELRANWWTVTRRRLGGNLSWRRLSPNRSLFMPIAQLEQPDSRAWRARTRVFGRQFSGGAWLTAIGVHFEGVLALGMVLGTALLVPQELLPDWEFLDWVTEDNTVMAWAWSVSSILAMSLIAPFYVAGGFGLYLSRRTNLEAWDIELSFRRWLEHMPVNMMPVVALLALLGLGGMPEAQADIRSESAQAITEVLASEDFGKQETITRWKFQDAENDSHRGSLNFDLQWLAQLLEVLAWLAVAALLAWLIVQLYRNRDRWQILNRGGRNLSPEQAVIGKTTPSAYEALPRDIPSAVHDCLLRGDARAAVGLLYRASLRVLEQHFALEISDSTTEGECLAAVRQERPGEEGEFFAVLTRQWIRVAYADLQPPAGQVEILLDHWCRVYGNCSGAAAQEPQA